MVGYDADFPHSDRGCLRIVTYTDAQCFGPSGNRKRRPLFILSVGKVKSGAEAIVAAQMQKALKGDAKAFEVLRDTAGQKPVDKVEQVNIDMEYEQSVEYIKELMGRREESSD